jgi:peptide deformylase
MIDTQAVVGEDIANALNADVPDFNDIELISYEDPRIHQPPPEFDFEKDQHLAEPLVKALFKKMFEWKGMGLSANQCGLPYKVFVMGDVETQLAIFNPVVTATSKKQVPFREGCLTYPGLYLTLQRPESCVLTYQTVTGETTVQEFPGLAARIALHEYDHMLGIDFTFHASKFKIDWELKKMQKTAIKTLRRRARESHNG